MHTFSNVRYPELQYFKYQLYRKYNFSKPISEIDQLNSMFGGQGYRSGWKYWTGYEDIGTNDLFKIKYEYFGFSEESSITIAKLVLPDCEYRYQQNKQ